MSRCPRRGGSSSSSWPRTDGARGATSSRWGRRAARPAVCDVPATKVDGIYSADPKQDANAQRLERVTYIEVLNRGLQVMDATAISLCMDNKLPIVVFDLNRPGNIKRIVLGETVGSIVSSGG